MPERQTDVELRDAARSVPDDVRRMAIEGDVLSVYMALCGRWIGGEWKPEPDRPVEGFVASTAPNVHRIRSEQRWGCGGRLSDRPVPAQR